MPQKPATVSQYLAALPPDRRAAVQAVRQVILKNLGKGYEEGIQYGAIGYFIPHRVYPAGYHCDPSQPLPFGGLASRKGYMAFGFMCHYWDGGTELAWFRDAWAKAGKKLDMGVCCVRFKKLEELPLDVIGEAVRRVPAKKFIELYESARKKQTKARPAARKKTIRRAAAAR